MTKCGLSIDQLPTYLDPSMYLLLSTQLHINCPLFRIDQNKRNLIATTQPLEAKSLIDLRRRKKLIKRQKSRNEHFDFTKKFHYLDKWF